MINVIVCITYDSQFKQYIVVGHSTESDGKGGTAKWEEIEEVIMRSHDLSNRRWDSLTQAIEDIKAHKSFRVKIKVTKPGEIRTASFV